MNKLLVYILLFHLWGTLQAQTYYYNETKTFYENGYTYRCDTPPSGLVTLGNKENKYTNTPLVFKDGSDANGAMVFHGMRPTLFPPKNGNG